MLFQEPSLFLVHFLIKRKMKEIGGGLANLERKLQQQMINHRHILIVWKMIWMFRMDYWGPLFSTIINIRITQKLMMIHWLRTKTSELRCKFQCNREGAFFIHFLSEGTRLINPSASLLSLSTIGLFYFRPFSGNPF